MKKVLLSVMAISLALSFGSCKKSSSDDSSALLLLLLGGELTEYKSNFNASGDLTSYTEIVYMSKLAYLKKLKHKISNNPLNTDIWGMDTDIYGIKSYKTSLDIGSDGLWFTNDDTFLIYWEFSKIESTVYNHITYSNFAGNVSGYTTYILDNNGRVLSTVSYNDPGANGTWFNVDDVVSGRTTTLWTSKDVGTKTNWNAAGTLVLSFVDVVRDTDAGTITTTSTLNNHTTVLMTITADFNTGIDHTSATLINMGFEVCGFNTLDSASRITQTINYIEDGDDNTWYTGDEVPGAMVGSIVRTDNTYNSLGYRDLIYNYEDAAGNTLHSHSTSIFE